MDRLGAGRLRWAMANSIGQTPRSKIILYPYYFLMAGSLSSAMYMMGRLVLVSSACRSSP
jgi:hypothetical protein